LGGTRRRELPELRGEKRKSRPKKTSGIYKRKKNELCSGDAKDKFWLQAPKRGTRGKGRSGQNWLAITRKGHSDWVKRVEE